MSFGGKGEGIRARTHVNVKYHPKLIQSLLISRQGNKGGDNL